MSIVAVYAGATTGPTPATLPQLAARLKQRINDLGQIRHVFNKLADASLELDGADPCQPEMG
ncbi:hypothetical protein HNQ71_007048 [Mesorhizobium sangaii]|uniref:Uncharacterized protein n=1 Tax=Mesorhizobium sangaii TaxID=505389 RepID=A0A841PNV7_9HYPH|nr:hypothetical protein [Mesorhizobium sangaii]